MRVGAGRDKEERVLIFFRRRAVTPEIARAMAEVRGLLGVSVDAPELPKRTFSFLLILFSLADTGGKESLPLVTIPAG